MPNPAVQLAPTGKLRVAIAIAPSPSAQFAIKDEATGAYRGVAVILGTVLAKKLGVPVELIAHNGSGEIQNSAADNKWDVAFLPVDEERKKFVDFGNAYHLLQSTYLVGPSVKIASVAAANTAGVRIGVANTATFRTSNKTAPNATHVSFDKTDAAVAALRDGRTRRAGVLARVADRPRTKSSRLAHSRRRLFEFDHVGGGAEGQAGSARLRHRIHRGGESLRPGAPGVRRDGVEELAGRAGGDEGVNETRHGRVYPGHPRLTSR